MAMAFTYRVLENGPRNFVLQVIGVDASSTTAATQNGSATGIIAANSYTPTTHLKIKKIIYNTTNATARIQWHANSNVDLAVLSGYGKMNVCDTQGIWDDGSTGATGDIDILSIAPTTVTAGSNPLTSAITLVFYAIKGA